MTLAQTPASFTCSHCGGVVVIRSAGYRGVGYEFVSCRCPRRKGYTPAVLWCGSCLDFKPHTLAESRKIHSAFDANYLVGVETLYACSACGERRRYGFDIDDRDVPKKVRELKRDAG